MSFKLSKEERERREEIASKLREQAEKVAGAVSAMNDAMTAAREIVVNVQRVAIIEGRDELFVDPLNHDERRFERLIDLAGRAHPTFFTIASAISPTFLKP